MNFPFNHNMEYLETHFKLIPNPIPTLEEQLLIDSRYNNIMSKLDYLLPQKYSKPLDITKITIENNEFFCGSAPKRNRIPNFLQILADNKITCIVSIGACLENDRCKIDQFWDKSMRDDTNTLYTTKSVLKVQTDFYVVRLIELFINGLPSYTFTQYHIIKWKDFSNTPIEHIVSVIDLVMPTNIQTEKMFIHCSAGSGRTGTFLAILLRLRFNMSMCDAINYLRKHRSSIQTSEQLAMVQDCLLINKSLAHLREPLKSFYTK